MSVRPSVLRDERAGALVVQVVVGLALAALAIYFGRSVLADMNARGLAPGFGFLRYGAGFQIGEGPAFASTESVGRAFLVGLANTLRVASVGVVLATGLGLAVALARLSGNPLLARLGAGYVALFRNTPLLVQLILWYRGVFLRLPSLADAVAIAPRGAEGALAFLSLRGLALPAFRTTVSPATWVGVLGIALGLSWSVSKWRLRTEQHSGRPARTVFWAFVTFLLPVAALWVLHPAGSFSIELPVRIKFGYEGGWVLTPEYAALLVGLVTYTAAFIAEVVRAGIEAVGRGQREAGLSVGLREGQLLRLVVLPQALRVVVPPLTSQYLNLTKNSSLAIAIGYPDLYNVGQTISNQTGQAVMVIFMIMGTYLTISLVTSALMNAYNHRVRLVER